MVERERRCGLAWAFLLVIGACGPHEARKPPAPSAVLLLRCDQAEAEMWLDSRYLREVQELKGGLRLPPGPHRLELRHTGFHSRYYELDLKADERLSLAVELAPRLR